MGRYYRAMIKYRLVKYAVNTWKTIWFAPAFIFLFLYSACVALAYLNINLGIEALKGGL